MSNDIFEDIFSPANEGGGTGPTTPQVQSDWAQTDDGEVDFIKNKPQIIGFFDAIVDYAGGTSPNYSSIKAAIDAGKSRIRVIADGTEADEITLSQFTLIYINDGVSVDLKRIDLVTTANRLIIIGDDRLGSNITYTPEAINQPLIYGAAALVKIVSIKYQNLGSFADCSVFEDGPSQMEDSIVISGNADNTGANFSGNINSYSKNCIFSSSTSGSTDTFKATYGSHENNYFDNAVGGVTGVFATISANVSLNNIQYDGLMNITSGGRLKSVYPDFNGVLAGANITNASGAAVYEDVELLTGDFTAGAFSDGRASNMRTLGEIITNANANNWIWDNINNGPDMEILGFYNTVIGSELGAFQVGTTADKTSIIGSRATSFIDSGTSTVKAGNDAIIGNTLPPFSSLIQTVANNTVTLVYRPGFSGKILGVAEKARSLVTAGSFSIKIDGATVTGLGAVVPTTAGSFTSATSANQFNATSEITITYSGAVTVLDHSINLQIQ